MEKMTIAQALRRVKKIKGQIAEHEQRAKVGCSYEKDKMPAFTFKEAVESMYKLQDEMVGLESRIAVANSQNNVALENNAVSLAYAIRQLQELKGRISFLKGLVIRNEVVKNRTSDWDDQEMKHITRVEEVAYCSDLSEIDRDKQVKELQNLFEELNNKVEDLNHQVMV